MDIVIVDGDCGNLWNQAELEKLLNAQHDTLWFCDDASLRKHGYNVTAASQAAIGASFEKAILLTRLQSGVMNYHKLMLQNTTGCRRWLIVIVGNVGTVYKEQYRSEIDSALNGTLRYEIIFDDPAKMQLTLKAKREIVDERPFCIIATRSDAEFAESVLKTLEACYADWRFECHVGMEEDSYRHADIILVIGRNEEDCAVPPPKENESRLRIWIELPRGRKQDDWGIRIIERMNQNGWNLGNRRIQCSCLANEMLLQELDSGKIGREALCTDDRFIMWDLYGLPLPTRAYDSLDRAEAFLRGQCCFPVLLGSEK